MREDRNLIPYNGRSLLDPLGEHPIELGAGALLITSRIFKSKDLAERSETNRQLSKNATDIAAIWLQTRPFTEHNIDALVESGTVSTGSLFPKGERSYARVRVRTW